MYFLNRQTTFYYRYLYADVLVKVCQADPNMQTSAPVDYGNSVKCQ